MRIERSSDNSHRPLTHHCNADHYSFGRRITAARQHARSIVPGVSERNICSANCQLRGPPSTPKQPGTTDPIPCEASLATYVPRNYLRQVTGTQRPEAYKHFRSGCTDYLEHGAQDRQAVDGTDNRVSSQHHTDHPERDERVESSRQRAAPHSIICTRTESKRA
jgi:hypothetical protein